MAEVKSNQPTGCQVAEFVYGHCETKTGEIEEKRQVRLRSRAAEIVDRGGEENAQAKPDNHAQNAFFWTRWRKNS